MKSKKNWHSTSIDEATVYCKLTYYIELNELCILHVLISIFVRLRYLLLDQGHCFNFLHKHI